MADRSTLVKTAIGTVTDMSSSPPELGGKNFSVEFTLDGDKNEKAFVLSRDELYDYDPKYVRGIMSRWWHEGDRIGWRMEVSYVPWNGRNMVIGMTPVESPDPEKDPVSSFYNY